MTVDLRSLDRRFYGLIARVADLRLSASNLSSPEFLALEQAMSALSDAIAAATASADTAISRVSTDITALKAQVAALQAQVDAGGSPADIQALADLTTKLNALDPTTPATIPPAVVAAAVAAHPVAATAAVAAKKP